MSDVIVLFGSAVPVEGSGPYEEAREMGRLLAQNGYAVMTGGYKGTMEGASHGAHEGGGKVIGVTCKVVEQFRTNALLNRYVDHIISTDTLEQRLSYLVRENNGIIVLSGGVGTLAELSLAWNLLLIHAIPPRPFVLLGKKWRAVIEALVESEPFYTGGAELKHLYLADTPQEVISFLTRFKETIHHGQ